MTLGPKVKAARDEKYRRWVASLPCCSCRIEGHSQAAHPNFGRGLGQKASDHDCFPLCAPQPFRMGCHAMFDQLVDISRDERRLLEVRYAAETRELAKAAGWFREAA